MSNWETRLFYALITATITVSLVSMTLSTTAIGIVLGWWDRPEWAVHLVGV